MTQPSHISSGPPFLLSTHASKWPHRTAAYPHSKQLLVLRSDHSKSTAKKVLSLFCHSSWTHFGSPDLTRSFCAARIEAGSVPCIFLYELESETVRKCRVCVSKGVTRSYKIIPVTWLEVQWQVKAKMQQTMLLTIGRFSPNLRGRQLGTSETSHSGSPCLDHFQKRANRMRAGNNVRTASQ